MISEKRSPHKKESTMETSIWRSILFFILLILAISLLGFVFFPGH